LLICYLGSSLRDKDWGHGVVFPFSVVSPNVNYPPAIYPLMFSGKNKVSSAFSPNAWPTEIGWLSCQETRRSLYGRLYRYIATVTLVSESGDTQTVDFPAGFTAFIPVETVKRVPSSVPYRTSVKAVESSRFTHAGCDEVDTTEKTGNKPGDKDKLGLNIVLYNGTTFVQGLWIVVSCLMYLTLATGHDYFVEVTLENSATETPHQYQASVSLERDVIVEGSPILVDDDDDEQAKFRGEFNFREIYADMARTQDSSRDFVQFPLATPVRRSLSRTFPRTTLNESALAPFGIRSFLAVSIIEFRNAFSMNPLPPDVIYTSRDNLKAKKPVEIGWEFDKCDITHYHTRNYKARIPVTVLGHDASVVLSEPQPVSYLQSGSRVAVPCVLSGHVTTAGANFEFDTAEPMVARESTKTASPGGSDKDAFGRFGGRRSMDAKAGQYVGALWHRKMAEEKMSRAPSMKSSGSQVVLKGQSL
jgi:hypothetical protein